MKSAGQKVRPEKEEKVNQIKTKIADSQILILADYRGMTVKEMTELRRELRKEEAEFVVLKNTLSAIALRQLGVEDLEKLLKEPLAMVFGYKDPVAPAKVLSRFCAEIEKPKIKGALLAKRFLAVEGVKQLAKLPSREELIAKTVGGIKAPLYGLVMVLSGPLRKLVYALDAIKNQKTQTN